MAKFFLPILGICFLLVVVVMAHLIDRSLAVVHAKSVRMPMYAGSWYPSDQRELTLAIDNFLGSVEERNLIGNVKAIVVPHAGYPFSGLVAANSFKQLGHGYKKVIVLGTSHHFALDGAVTVNYTHYRTPLGDIPIGQAPGIPMRNDVDRPEHSIEIELPFLQRQIGNFTLVPIIVGKVDPGEFAKTLDSMVDEDTLIVISVDLSHYHPYEDAVRLDNSSINHILSLDSTNIFSDEIDSSFAVSSLLELSSLKGWNPTLLKYANSGDVKGDKERVVGYAAIAFTDGISMGDQEFLVKLARSTLEFYVKSSKLPEQNDADVPKKLLEHKGCFVTLNKFGDLRGCIGHILPQESLYKCVVDNAVNAAAHDSRFSPVKPEELEDIKVEVSVLTVPEKLSFYSPQDLLSNLKKDGVVLKSGLNGATYLPQVWDMMPDKSVFLSSLCEKAGAKKDCWNDPSTEILTYQAQVFGESS